MIFIANSQGTISAVVPSPIYQGSNLANEVVLIAPFAQGNAVDLAVLLPNGARLQPILMTAVPNFTAQGITDADGVALSAWSVQVPQVVTEYAGIAQVQFRIYTTTQTISTSSTGWDIQKGVSPILPTDPDTDIYTQILQALATAQNAIDKNTEDIAQNKTDIETNKNNIAQLQQGIETANRNISQNAANIDALGTELADVKTDVATNAENIQNNTEDIARLQPQNIERLEIEVAQNTTDIAQNETNIAANAEKIAQNETNIAANAEKIAQVENDYVASNLDESVSQSYKDNSVLIGAANRKAAGTANSVVIGPGATSNSYDVVAIGFNARATSGGLIQIGSGTNSERSAASFGGIATPINLVKIYQLSSQSADGVSGYHTLATQDWVSVQLQNSGGGISPTVVENSGITQAGVYEVSSSSADPAQSQIVTLCPISDATIPTVYCGTVHVAPNVVFSFRFENGVFKCYQQNTAENTEDERAVIQVKRIFTL